ncbi:MAG TPA: alpha-xylosidase [Kofleriaceae bacterium]|nr:alpha-xylosidase [Kofleriaceae bacterium]
MKFTHGYWQKRDGVRALHPVALHSASASDHALTVYAATRPVTGRADTLDMPLVTITVGSPMPDVIRVEVSHFRGGRPRRPELALNEGPGPIEITTEPEVGLTAGALSARFRRGGWGLDFVAGGRVLTGSGRAGMGVVELAGQAYVHEQLALGVDEHVYGLGERFGPLVKNGQAIDIWNEDGGTSSELAYKNIPFYLTDRGYGVLVNHPGRVSFEVGSELVSRVQFSVAGQSLEYLVIYGPTPADILRKYTQLTGRPALPPAWSFGLWLTTSFTTSYDEATVTSFLDGMAARGLPLSVFHFDTFWMRELHWCDFAWDRRAFPDPEGMLARLLQRGLRTCLWINPYIAQQSALFTEGMAQGYLVRTRDGDVWQTDLWQAGMALVDFTNPAARAWYASKLRALLDMGASCFKSDFGERIPTDVVYFDGSDPERMHNYYTQLYNQTVFELLREHRGDGEAIVFARSATAGGQRFPVHWGGDSTTTFESMAETLRGGLSLAMCGFGFWSHDIGGFEGTPDPAVFKRWIAFGLLSSHSRLHGNQSYRVPWLFDDEAVVVLRRFVALKHRLMPYLYGAAGIAHREGIPVLRPMALEFPDDPACAYLERQYMLGPDLLVAPVFSADGDVSYYVPAGRWTDLVRGTVISGPRWVRERHGFDSVPVLVRPGAVVATGAREDRPDYDYVDGVTLRVHELDDGARVVGSIPTVNGEVGATFAVMRHGREIRVERSAAQARWSVLVVGCHAITASEERVTVDPDGARVEMASGVAVATITVDRDDYKKE